MQKGHLFPQIAIAIGVLTSNRGGGRRTTLADWTWHQGAIAGCHCSVLWWGETMVGQLWGSGRGTRVPLQGAIAIPGCHCDVLWWGETMVGQLWGSGRGTRVPLQGAICWVPLQGAIVMCYGGGRRWWANFGGVDVDVAPGCHCRVPL